jgi:c-di-GMP-binding flagellar brake protein YcgR
MKKNSDELLVEATRDELLACIRLLALSVVQHRAKCGFVTFKDSMTQLHSFPEGSEEFGLHVQGKQVLEEALELARSLATESPLRPETEEPSSNLLAENRRQLRINVTAPIKVLWPGDAAPVDANLENISWGGAAIHVTEAKGSTGDKLEIILPSTRRGSITVEAKIIRAWALPDGRGEGVATRFSSLSTRDESELENVLEVLAQSGDSEGQRKYARLTQRLEIQFDDMEELRATLEDISAGGLGITVPDPLELDQSFQAVISTLDERCSLKLRARVVHQEPVSLGNTEIYHVGLKFEHPSEELRDRTNELIREMAAMNPAKNTNNADDTP